MKNYYKNEIPESERKIYIFPISQYLFISVC